jgi:hypothetical protein
MEEILKCVLGMLILIITADGSGSGSCPRAVLNLRVQNHALSFSLQIFILILRKTVKAETSV